MISSISLARQIHFEVLHVQLRIHGGIVFLWGVLAFMLTFVSVRCLMCMHDLSRLASLWTIA